MQYVAAYAILQCKNKITFAREKEREEQPKRNRSKSTNILWIDAIDTDLFKMFNDNSI